MSSDEKLNTILDVVSSVTQRPRDQLDVDQPFLEMGVESLQAVTIISNLNQSLELDLPPTIFFDYPSIRQLADFLAQSNSDVRTSIGQRSESASRDSIAIIGMSCRFPKARGLDEYWSLLKEGKDAITEDARGIGGFIEGVDEFDAQYFGISDAEAKHMDPQQRLLLEVAHEAIENAGYTTKDFKRSRTGVFVGISSSDYAAFTTIASQTGAKPGIYEATGNAHSIAANRISYLFDLRGPSVALDTACSSSLVAIHHACQSLQSGESTHALAGGVNIILNSNLHDAFTQAQMLSPDGRCKTFSEEANGYVRGEGVGVILLKRLSNAISDGDHIWAVIRGSAVNQDGRSSGLTAPNGPSQEAVIQEALFVAGIRGEDIDYVEAHGTGTPLGDPIEYLSLSKALGSSANCLVGSVKSNIGHLEASAGIASVIKSALSLRNAYIPRSLHFKKINPKIGDRCPNLSVVSEGRNWPEHAAKGKFAGVSSFGFGGTNAHLILEDFRQSPRAIADSSSEDLRFYLCGSASGPKALTSLAKSYLHSLSKISDPKLLSEFCQASASARLNFSTRLIVNGSDAARLQTGLQSFLDSQENPSWSMATVTKTKPKLAFLFTGQGAQYPGMGNELFRCFPEYRNAFEDCCENFDRYFPADLLSVVKGSHPDSSELLSRTDYGQAALFSVGYALSQLLRVRFGIKPDFVLGHSLGEIIAATAAGVMNLESAAWLVAERGRLMQLTAEGAMLALFTNTTAAEKIIGSSGCDVAAFNGPELVVASGDAQSIQKLEALCVEQKIRTSRLRNTRAFHSRLMEPVLDSFEKSADKIQFQAPLIPLVSSMTGEFLNDCHTSAYWKKHLRQPTRFESAMKTLERAGCSAFLEIGPHPTLITMAQGFVKTPHSSWFHLLARKNAEEVTTFSRGLSELGVHGLWDPAPEKPVRSPTLPLSVFDRIRHWAWDKEMKPTTPLGGESTSEVSEEVVLAEMKEVIGKLLHMDSGSFNADEPLIDMGADSLLLLNALQTIKDKYHVAIAISDIFQELSTARKIAARVSELTKTSEAQETKSPSKTSSVAAPAGSSGKRGVLGNFRNFSSREEILIAPGETEEARKTEYLDRLIDKFTRRTPKTKQHAQRFRLPLSDNRASAGFRPNLKELIYPIVCQRAKGSRFHDLDGNEYIDFTMGFGVNLFGHSPDFIETAIHNQIKRGMCVGPQSELAGLVAEKMSAMVGHERVAFLNSGTEAVMTAMRLARAGTHREKIVLFDGSYHGHFDGVLARAHAMGTMPVAAGITRSTVSDIYVLDYGTDESIEFIRTHAGELAGVLVESVQSRYPEHQPAEFLKEIRAITEKSGTALIFDEVITGFRIHTGGAQAHFGVRADIASYGKILGGGLPIGAIAGRAKYLDAIDGGFWEYGNDSFPKAEMTFFAGTFCKHPLAMAAANAVLDKLAQEGTTILDRLNSRTAKLAAELNEFFTQRGLDIEVNNFGSLFRFKGQANLDLLFYNLNLRGIYVWEGRNLFLSDAHSEADIRRFSEVVRESTDELIDIGYFKKRSAIASEQSITGIPLIAPQYRFARLARQGSLGEAASHICIAVKMKGPLNIELLKQSFIAVMNHYDAFRLRFDLEQSVQWLDDRLICPFEKIDLKAVKIPWRTLDSKLLEEGSRPFRLSKEPPIRFALYEMGEENAILSIVTHHAGLDGWSMAQFIEEAAQAYQKLEEGQNLALPKRLQFADFLGNANRFGSQQKIVNAKTFWESKFNRIPDSIEIDRQPDRAKTTKSLDGQRLSFEIQNDLYHRIKKTALAWKVTPLMFFLGAFYEVMAELSGTQDLTIGVPAGNRDLDGADKMIGECANLLPIRIQIQQGESLAERTLRVKSELLSSLQNMVHPYEDLQERMGGPLFNVCLNVEPLSELPDFNDVSLFIYTYPIIASEFDMTMNITDLEYYYHVEIDFKKSWASEDSIRRFYSRFSEVISQSNK